MSAFHLRKRNLTRYLPQSNRILNLGTAFTFLTAFQLYAGTSYSQTTTLSLSLKNATLELLKYSFVGQYTFNSTVVPFSFENPHVPID